MPWPVAGRESRRQSQRMRPRTRPQPVALRDCLLTPWDRRGHRTITDPLLLRSAQPYAEHTPHYREGYGHRHQPGQPHGKTAQQPLELRTHHVTNAIDEGVDERLRLVLVFTGYHGEQRFSRRPNDRPLHRTERGLEDYERRQRSRDGQSHESERNHRWEQGQ